MQPLNRFLFLAKRWWWLVILGVVLCGGTTYGISKLIHPVYRATATLIVSFQLSSSASDGVTASLAAVPTYAQLLQSPSVLEPVVAQHRGMTLQQLSAMMTVTTKPNSQLIELDVDNTDPVLAMNLANEISDQFVQYINPQLQASVVPVYAMKPTDVLRPKPSQYGAIGALVGLGLALALIFLFEWIDDRIDGPEEVQDLLGMEVLTTIPQFSRSERNKKTKELPAQAEAYRILCASLEAAQASQPFKLVMVTSALAGEGKSTVAANLASFLALAGRRVLLVDADLRRPAQYRRFHLDNSIGLSHAFTRAQPQFEVEALEQPTDIPTLSILTAGTPSSNSAELFQSSLVNKLFEYFKKAPFDYVLFDTPPLLPVADAQLLASHVHAAVLVVDASKTPRKILLRVKHVLGRTSTTILGIAINKCHWPEYGYIRDYQRYARPAKTTRIAVPSPDTLFDSLKDLPTAKLPSLKTEEDRDVPDTPVIRADGDSITNPRLKRIQIESDDKE